MKLVERLLKWTTRGLLVVFLLLIGWGVIAYWTSTNECDQKTTALIKVRAASLNSLDLAVP